MISSDNGLSCTRDDNVLYKNTMVLAAALEKAGFDKKLFAIWTNKVRILDKYRLKRYIFQGPCLRCSPTRTLVTNFCGNSHINLMPTWQ